MKPTLLSGADIQHYLDEGYWSRETHVESLRSFAISFSNTIACRDEVEVYTWAELEVVSNHIAANLIKLGLSRDSRALVRMSSSCREMVLRIALKKAGIIGVFVPMQWRQKELSYVCARTDPALLIISQQGLNDEELKWFDDAFKIPRVILDPPNLEGWQGWDALADALPEPSVVEEISERAFAFDEVSLITASSGTSGIAKLCEWPEAAQLCIGRSIGERLRITRDDTIGIFSPMSGAAGVLVWLVSATIPATFVFPKTYNAPDLLGIIGKLGITVATTVPVIMSRLAQEPLADHNLISLRALRVGTAAADMSAARKFEEGADCRVVVAAGSMECPGFAHADFDEDREIRLNGSIGLRLPGCRSRIIGDDGEEMSALTVGELIVSAPYAASGYWNDPNATRQVWHKGWYSTGDVGCLSKEGRLTLKGRLKDTINCSGLKILPAEVEQEIAMHPSVFECAVVAAPDVEYGEVPWAFIQPQPGVEINVEAIIELLKNRGLANYKVPTRFVAIPSLPRISGNKVDKKNLLETVLSSDSNSGETFNAN